MASKGVIVEFDFTAMDGAALLFRTAKKFLDSLDGIKLDAQIEAKYFAGNDYQSAFAKLFPIVKTKKTAAKAARDFTAAFTLALNEAVPASITPSFRNFVKTLSDKGVSVVIMTRASLQSVAAAFVPVLIENVALYQGESTTYGSVTWDVFRRACAVNKLRPSSTVVVTGSGFGVKSSLLAGSPSIAVLNDRVAYQDFSGADDVVRELNAATAKKVLGALRVA